MKRYLVCVTCGAVLFTGCYAAPYKDYATSIQKSNDSIAQANQAYYQYLTEVARANAVRDQRMLELQATANAKPLVEMIPDGKGGFITKVNRQDTNLAIAPAVIQPPPAGFIKPSLPEMETKAAVEFGKTLVWGGAAAYGLHGLWNTMKAIATPAQANNTSNNTVINNDSGNSTSVTKTQDNDTTVDVASTVTEDNDTITKTTTTTSDSYNPTTQTATAYDNDTTTVNDNDTLTDDHHTEENSNDNSTSTWQPVEPVDNSGGATGTN